MKVVKYDLDSFDIPFNGINITLQFDSQEKLGKYFFKMVNKHNRHFARIEKRKNGFWARLSKEICENKYG